MRYKYQLWLHAAFAFFCALLIVSTSFAWVAQNRRTSAENEVIKIEPMGVTIENYEAYWYDMETNTVKKRTEGIEPMNMTAYDSIFTERNINTPLLIVVRLRDIQADGPVALNIAVKCQSEHNFAPNNPDDSDNFTSNIVHMKAASAAMAGVSIAENADEAAYEPFFKKVCKYFNEPPANEPPANSQPVGGQFLTVDHNTGTKYDVVELTIRDVTPVNHAATVYLIIDYDVALVEAQEIVAFGGTGPNTGNKVSFKNDIESITFSCA